MQRINLFIDDSDYITLKQLPGTLTEHVKQAIKEYLNSLYKVNVSASQSKNGQE